MVYIRKGVIHKGFTAKQKFNKITHYEKSSSNLPVRPFVKTVPGTVDGIIPLLPNVLYHAWTEQFDR